MTRDPKSVERVDVFRNDTRVGELRRTDVGAVFEFDRGFHEAHRERPGGLATHLPYAQRVIETRGVNLHPYFAGLLPEGLRLRALLSRVKSSEDDQFSLLVAAGADCVGDLFPVLPGSKRGPLEHDDDELRPVDQVSFSELLARSLESSDEPAVAGVQEKLSPAVISFPFATRSQRWLLKLNPRDKPQLIENEHFFMRMAEACGLDVAKTHLVKDRTGERGLLVRRFDRRREGRRWRGVHQEDGCQFLNRYPADKYRVTTSDLAVGLAQSASPISERARLLELVAFSYLIGNGDLHAKNVSLGGDLLSLTPAYDLLSARPYKDLKLALKFEGRDDNVKRRHFIEFGARFQVSARAVEARLDRLVARAKPFISRVKELGYDARLTKQLADLMKKRLDDLK